MNYLKQYGEFIYRAMMFLGIVALLYLNSHYVSIEEFAKTKEDVQSIKSTLLVMAQYNTINERQNDELKDLSHRLLEVEKKIR